MATRYRFERTSHDAEHLGARKERVVMLDLDLVGVVCDELQAEPSASKTWLQHVTEAAAGSASGERTA